MRPGETMLRGTLSSAHVSPRPKFVRVVLVVAVLVTLLGLAVNVSAGQVEAASKLAARAPQALCAQSPRFADIAFC